MLVEPLGISAYHLVKQLAGFIRVVIGGDDCARPLLPLRPKPKLFQSGNYHGLLTSGMTLHQDAAVLGVRQAERRIVVTVSWTPRDVISSRLVPAEMPGDFSGGHKSPR